jgi:periplasmic divalent cation tolerance protein
MTAGELCEIIVSAPDRDWLTDLCRQIIEAAASAHVVHPITSIYRWDGTIRETTEARAFLRSRRELVGELTRFIVARHPYEVVNVTAFPIIDGNPIYLAWVTDETAIDDA